MSIIHIYIYDADRKTSSLNRKKYFDDSAGISHSRERLKAHIRFGLNGGLKTGIRKTYLNDVFVIDVFVSLDIIFLYNFLKERRSRARVTPL